MTYGGAPRVWNYSWTHFGNENEVLQLEETNTNVGKRDACIRLCGSFHSDGKDARIYTYV